MTADSHAMPPIDPSHALLLLTHSMSAKTVLLLRRLEGSGDMTLTVLVPINPQEVGEGYRRMMTEGVPMAVSASSVSGAICLATHAMLRERRQQREALVSWRETLGLPASAQGKLPPVRPSGSSWEAIDEALPPALWSRLHSVTLETRKVSTWEVEVQAVAISSVSERPLVVDTPFVSTLEAAFVEVRQRLALEVDMQTLVADAFLPAFDGRSWPFGNKARG